MELEVVQRRDGSTTVITAKGEVDVWTAERLKTALHEADGADTRDIIVDLTDVSFLDSTGIGVLVGGLRRRKEAGGSFHLVVTRPHILKVLSITSLDRVFPVHDSLTAAKTALADDSQ